MADAGSGRLKVVVVTPERAVLDTAAESVTLPLYDGEIGVLTGHSPFVGQLGPGELRITAAGGAIRRLFVDGGFAQVRGDVVNVLTQFARTAEEITDAAVAAERAKADAQPTTSTAEMATKNRLTARANGLERVRARVRG
jgi:F-type H+-transporting ATPase subunit epsilon